MTKKEFALAQIVPYYKDPSSCARNENGNCEYLSANGKMCVVGKNLLDANKFKDCDILVKEILAENTQEKVFKPESCNILNVKEWSHLQDLHDYIACMKTSMEEEIEYTCNELGLFTYEELIEESKK